MLLGKPLAAVFLQDGVLIEQTAYFLKVLCLSLTITVLRNAELFIPGVIVLNYLWQLNGVIAAQPVVEIILTIICIVMYLKDIKNRKDFSAPIE